MRLSGPDFKQASEAALHSARELLRTWYPTGKFRGREYVVGDLDGNPGESLSINVETGQWSDFATGECGGDLISLYAAKNRTSQGEALRALAEGLAIRPGPARTIETIKWQPLPLPTNAPSPDMSGFNRVHTYRDASGRATHYVGRTDAVAGRKKSFCGITWGILDGKVGWHRKQTTAPRPLYALDRLAKMPEAVALVCEGEKAADTAQAMFPDMAVSTWACGTSAVSGADWSPLAGRNVVLWPDNDQPGHKAMREVAAILGELGATVRILRVDDLPEKADAADMELDDPAAWLTSRLPARPELQAEEAPDDDANYMDSLVHAASVHANSGDDTPAQNVAGIVRRFNGRYMVVNEAGKAMVFHPKVDPILKRRFFDRITFSDLRLLYMNEQVIVGKTEDGQSVYKSAANVWLGHPDRRQYIHGVTFDPATENVGEGVLNLWEGFSVKPVKGDWKLMKSHLLAVCCKGNLDQYEYLLRWMARLLQRPAEQGEVAVVLRGQEGTGKGTVAKALMRITGHHGLAISNTKHLVGNFNAHLRDVVFLFADEAFFAGDRGHVGALKSLITEEYLTIEAKYSNAHQTPNFLHVMMASNEDWVVPASLEARRFFVLDVDECARGQHKYFDLLNAEMDAGGLAAMLHDLLTLDITGFNVRAVPNTDGLQRQRKLSLQTPETWWMDCLERGYVFRSKLGLEATFANWTTRVAMDLMMDSYLEFARARGERRLLTRETLGKFLIQMGGKPCRWRRGIIGEHIVDVDTYSGGSARKSSPVIVDRAHGHEFPGLDDARALFIGATGLDVMWNGGSEDSDEKT